MNAAIPTLQNPLQLLSATTGTGRKQRLTVRAVGAGLLVLLLAGPIAPVLAATAPNLGSTAPFAIVSDTFTNSNTSPQTDITGNVCFSTGPVTPPLTITGSTTSPCPPVTGNDQGLALANLNGQPCLSLGAGAVALDGIIHAYTIS